MIRPLHRLLNDEPEASGSTPVDNSLPETVAPEVVTPDPTPAEETPDTFASLEKAMGDAGLLEGVEPPAATPAPTPAPEAAAAPGATPAPTPAPEVDLSPPEGMSERAQSRWSALTERVKVIPELERQATEAKTQLESVREMVAQSGLRADEFTEMLETGRLLKSTAPQDLEAALARIDGIRTDIALRLGKDVPGADPLAAHADLLGEVEAMTITRERALEIAKLRGTQQRVQAQTQESDDAAAFTKEVNQAAAGIETALASKVGTPGHDAKVAYVRSYLADPKRQQAFVATYQPKQWAATVLSIYDAYTPPAAPAPVSNLQPLRPGNTRSGAPINSAPRNAEAAVEGAFARLGL